MDWGLEKDLLVPSNEQLGNMVKGQKYVVKVCYHEKTDRVYATGRIEKHCDKNTSGLKAGQKVDLMIYDFSEIGILAIVNNQYSGMLYRNETFKRLEKGEKIEGYITKIRDDGKLDLSLKQTNQESLDKSGTLILEKLKLKNGFIPCHDKSSPKEIKDIFSMSKSEFKKSIGGLYKTGKIEISKEGISLKKE
jgi:predicted RNA-binding protein (virulence factor B family)